MHLPSRGDHECIARCLDNGYCGCVRTKWQNTRVGQSDKGKTYFIGPREPEDTRFDSYIRIIAGFLNYRLLLR